MPRPHRKLRPEEYLPSRDAGDLFFRDLAGIGKGVGTHAEWIWMAVGQIEAIAKHRDEFTVDDLRERLQALGCAEPPDSRAYGTAFREAVRLGHVEKSDRVVMSKVREHVENPKARPITVWRSMVEG